MSTNGRTTDANALVVCSYCGHTALPYERSAGAFERIWVQYGRNMGALGSQCRRIVSALINALIVRPRMGTFALMMRSSVWVQYERMLP